jgi:hypothetical protein
MTANFDVRKTDFALWLSLISNLSIFHKTMQILKCLAHKIISLLSGNNTETGVLHYMQRITLKVNKSFT